MKLAIVLPCYNEEEVIDYSNEILCGVILNLLQNRIVEDVSIVYVDDGSCDKTWERIESLSAQRHINPKITGIAGDVIEQSVFGYDANSDSSPDLNIDGILTELKTTGIRISKKNPKEYEAKEPMSITGVSPNVIIDEE